MFKPGKGTKTQFKARISEKVSQFSNLIQIKLLWSQSVPPQDDSNTPQITSHWSL